MVVISENVGKGSSAMISEPEDLHGISKADGYWLNEGEDSQAEKRTAAFCAAVFYYVGNIAW